MHYYPVKGPVTERAESSSTAESSPQEPSRPGSRNIKRKVMRKKNGESRVFDESFASTDSGKFNNDYYIGGKLTAISCALCIF